MIRTDESADAWRIPTAAPMSDWKRPAGRPHSSWLATVKNYLSHHNLSVEDATDRAGTGQATLEIIGSKWSFTVTWCKPKNDRGGSRNSA